jgi:hypothetical protein
MCTGLCVALGWLIQISACAGPGANPEPSTPAPSASVTPVPTGPAVRFRFRALDGREISSDRSLGRNTVIAFITTYDIASQAQARVLSGIAHGHVPRTNCYALVIEPDTAGLLVEAFVKTLNLSYPVGLVPPEKLRKSGLRMMKSVPSVLVLDRGGRIAWKKKGMATEDELTAVLEKLE